MIRLIRYEFIKQFCKRSILALFVVFSLANLFKIYGEYKSYSYLTDGNGERSWHTLHWQLYEEYQGEITPEKVERLLAVYQPLVEATSDMTASTATDDPNTMTGNLYSDRNLLDKYFVQPMQYSYEYSGRSEQVANRARQSAALYGERGAVYQQRESGAIYNLYAGRTIPAFSYREMCNYYLNYDFSIILTLLLCLYGIIGTFVSERETQMDMLLLVSPNGGRKTALAKILAATLFLLLTSLWFSLLDLIGFAASFQTLEGLALPVFAIPNFAEVSVNFSIFQYVLLSAALKCAGAWVMGMLWLSGCSVTESANRIFNSSSQSVSETYSVIYDDQTRTYALENRATGALTDLALSPLFGAFSDGESVKAVYMDAPYIYYMASRTEQYVDRVGSYNSTATQVSIVQLDTETFEEQVIFEKITDSGRSLLGIDYTVGDTWMFLQYCYGFFLNNDSLFFITNDGITEVSRTIQRTQVLDIPTRGNIAFDGRTIYFINENSLLTTYDTKTQKARPFRNMVACDFCLTDQGLYFINRMDSDCVYLCGKDGVGSLKVSNDPALSVEYDGENVTMILKSDGKEVVFEP